MTRIYTLDGGAPTYIGRLKFLDKKINEYTRVETFYFEVKIEGTDIEVIKKEILERVSQVVYETEKHVERRRELEKYLNGAEDRRSYLPVLKGGYKVDKKRDRTLVSDFKIIK